MDQETKSPLQERLARWTEVDRDSGCWNWIGSVTRDGYSKVFFQGKTWSAHTVAYLASGRTLPEGLELDHLCRNRRCVNPDHLEPVTHRENCLRGTGPIADNAAALSCRKDHPFDVVNTYYGRNGRRTCRKCNAGRVKAYVVRKRAGAQGGDA